MSQQDPARDLRVLSEALLRAWQNRSVTEQQSFEQRIGTVLHPSISIVSGNTPPIDASAERARSRDPSPYPRYPSLDDAVARKNYGDVQYVEIIWNDGDIQEVARSFERIAAVSGAINPLELKSTEGGGLADIALDRIASGFDRTRTPTGWEWTLRSDRRAVVLAALPRPELVGELGKARNIQTDPAGNAFRKLLLEGALSQDDAPLDAEVIAYSWLDLVEPVQRQQTRRLRLENARGVILKAQDHLLVGGFFGRENDVERLRAFAEQSADSGSSRVLSVTGIGGVGKSTLLAAALRPAIARSFEDNTAPIVISIDFDRRLHANGAELELSFELSRQLELFYPEIGKELEALRESVTRDRVVRGELTRELFDSEADSVARHSYEFANRAGPILDRIDLEARPLLLIVDTFEEWQRSRFGRWDTEHPIRRFLSWLGEIQNTWNLHVDVIICGRAPVSADGLFVSAGTLDLKDLKRSEAVELLRHQGITKREALALARVAGGNPLALKLAARYYDRLPQQSRSAFLADGAQEMEGLEAALRQGILYRRFLDHIADPQARKLAHPGLALRRVTTELIQEVLAGPCDLGPLGHFEAEDLLLRLAQEVWLVEGGWPVITHRPELRRVMLRAMKSDPAQSARIRDVHMAALRWYEQHADRSEEDTTEAVYHRLAVADCTGDTIDFDLVPERILQKVAQSADEFEITLRAELLYRAGRQLNASEAAHLPAKARHAWAQARASSLVRSGQPERALTLWQELGDGAVPGGWYSAAAFQSFDLPKGIMPFQINAAPHMDSLRYDFLLAHSLGHDAPDEAARYRHWLRQALDWQLEQAEEQELAAITLEALYFESIVDRAAALTHRRRMSTTLFKQSFSATSQQYIRIRKVIGGGLFMPDRKLLKIILSSLFCPTTDLLERILMSPTYINWSGAGLLSFAEEFWTALREGVPSDQLLGPWAERFASVILQDLDRAGNSDDFISAIFDELRSDDPEWRVPIRTAIAEAARAPSARERLALAVTEVLGPTVPTDLQLPNLLGASSRSGRKTWGRAIEFLDRAGALGNFMWRCLEADDARLQDVAGRYLQWSHLRQQSAI